MQDYSMLIIEDLTSFNKVAKKQFNTYDVNMLERSENHFKEHIFINLKKNIDPLRQRLNLIYFLLKGSHNIFLGTENIRLKDNDLVIVPENMVFYSAPMQNCQGYCIRFKTEFIQSILDKPLEIAFPYFDFEAEHIIKVANDESNMIVRAFKDLISEYSRFSTEKDFLLRNYIHILLLRIREIYSNHTHWLALKISRNRDLANQFKHMLEKNFDDLRMVKHYAKRLNICPTHLTHVVKKTFGKTPKQMINEKLLMQSKVLLYSSNFNISEIAFKLHFNDPSHFCHFIKKHTGCTPQELRQLL